MKTRTGFISNSSTSSFLCLAREIKFEQVEGLLKNKKKVFADTGMYLEHKEFAEVNLKMIPILKKAIDNNEEYQSKLDHNLHFYEVLKYNLVSEGEDNKLPTKLDNISLDDISKFKVYHFIISQGIIDNAEDLDLMYKGNIK